MFRVRNNRKRWRLKWPWRLLTMIITSGRFLPGDIVITPGVKAALSPDEAFHGLVRHLAGDWGELDEHDRKQNEAALDHGFRLLSTWQDGLRLVPVIGSKQLIFKRSKRNAPQDQSSRARTAGDPTMALLSDSP